MIFTPVNAQKSIDGLKRATSRIKKPGEGAIRFHGEIVAIIGARGRLRWELGQTLAVQPGRTKKEIGRIEVMELGEMKIQDISEDQIVDEGCSGREEFISLWNSINRTKGRRWEDNPEVWTIGYRPLQ